MSLLSQFFPSGGGSSESLLSNTGAFTVDFLLVGGGGGGGSLNPCVFPATCASPCISLHPANATAGGGGGGRVVQVIGARVQTGVSYPIVIGAGGAANSSGSSSKFSDFIAGGGANGGGDPTSGIAGYYYQTLTNSAGMAGGDAQYLDGSLRCLNGSPLCPLYSPSEPLTAALRWSGRDGGIETRRNSTSYGQLINAGNYKSATCIAGNICGNNTYPNSPLFGTVQGCLSGQTGANSGRHYYTGWCPSGDAGSNYMPGQEQPVGSPLGFSTYENEIFKKNSLGYVHCSFGMGGYGANSWNICVNQSPSSTNAWTYNLKFNTYDNASGASAGGLLKGMWREALDNPTCSPNLPTYPAFNRDMFMCKCGSTGGSLTCLTDYATSGGAGAQFPPISSPSMRLALASSSVQTGCFIYSSPGNPTAQFCRMKVGTLVDHGPRVGSEFYPAISPSCVPLVAANCTNINEWGVLESFTDGFICSASLIPNAPLFGPYVNTFQCCNSYIDCNCNTWTPRNLIAQSPAAGRIFFCGPIAQFSFYGGCCLLSVAAPITCTLVSATPYLHAATWKAAESGISGSGNGGGGGIRVQGYCDGVNNTAFKYTVLNGTGPFGPNSGYFCCGAWICSYSGATFAACSPSGPAFSINWPSCASSSPYGIKCLNYQLSCSPPAVLAGGAGGGGSLWVVYPSDLPAATVTGNTAVSSPPAFRIYYWEGNGTITFNP
jgi:hypothetical protein